MARNPSDTPEPAPGGAGLRPLLAAVGVSLPVLAGGVPALIAAGAAPVLAALLVRGLLKRSRAVLDRREREMGETIDGLRESEARFRGLLEAMS